MGYSSAQMQIQRSLTSAHIFVMGLDDSYGAFIGSAVFMGIQSEWITMKFLWVIDVEGL